MAENSSRRPNFILFITDQHRVDYLGCYGHQIVKTPNIDGIAARGTAFDKFYVASPVCMPNRSSLMTGRMPSVHGVRCNGIPLSRNSVTFVDLLREAGYATALVGKSHLQNFSENDPILKLPKAPDGMHQPPPELMQAIRNDLGSPPYQQEEPSYWEHPGASLKTPFYGFDHVVLATNHGDEVGGEYLGWLRERAPGAEKLLGPANSLPHDYICPQAHRTAIPEELYSTAFIGDRASAFLQSMKDRKNEQPFYLMVSFPDPHHPFNPPGKYWDMYKPEQFPVPEAFQRNDWEPPPHVRAVIEAREKGAANLKGMGTIGTTVREAQEAQALTCGMITCVDDAIGGVLRTLEQCGMRDDTILVFTTDHGDHLGDHRLLLKGAEQYESIIHVPFIWSDPQEPNQPARTDALASTIDISATVLERARIAPYVGLQGRSVLKAVSERDVALRDSVFIQYDHQAPNAKTGRPPRVHSLVDGRWRLSVFEGEEWGELYDLENDPGEFDNLWASPDHAGVRAGLMERLTQAEIAHIDVVPMPTRRA